MYICIYIICIYVIIYVYIYNYTATSQAFGSYTVCFGKCFTEWQGNMLFWEKCSETMKQGPGLKKKFLTWGPRVGLKNSPENERPGDQAGAYGWNEQPPYSCVCVSVGLHGHVCKHFTPTSSFPSSLKTSLSWKPYESMYVRYFCFSWHPFPSPVFLVPLFPLAGSLLPHSLSLWFYKGSAFSGSLGGVVILKSSCPQILNTSDWLRRTKETLAGMEQECSLSTHATAVPATLLHQLVSLHLLLRWHCSVFLTVVYKIS